MAPRPATWGPLVATPARPRGRLGQRGLEPESLRSRGICVGNEDVCKAPARLRGLMTKSCVQSFYPPHAAKLHGTEGFTGASACDLGPSRDHPGAAQRALWTAWAGARIPPKQGDLRRKQGRLQSASAIARFDDEAFRPISRRPARSGSSWHTGIHRRLGLRLGALSWPPRRGPEGALDSVG